MAPFVSKCLEEKGTSRCTNYASLTASCEIIPLRASSSFVSTQREALIGKKNDVVDDLSLIDQKDR